MLAISSVFTCANAQAHQLLWSSTGHVSGVAKGTSWIWHPPLTDSVNKVAASNSSCHVLPTSVLPPPKEEVAERAGVQRTGLCETQELSRAAQTTDSISNRERKHQTQSWTYPKSLWLSYDDLPADAKSTDSKKLPQFTMEASRASGLTKPLVPLNSCKIFLYFQKWQNIFPSWSNTKGMSLD